MAQRADDTSNESTRSVWVVTVICGVLLVGHLGMRAYHDQLRDGLDAVALGLTAVGLSPWIARVLESFKFGGVEFKFVQQQIEDQRQDIEALQFLLLGFVSEYELRHLQKLHSGREFVRDGKDYPEEFTRQLRHLRNLGLIAHHPGKGVRAMYNDPGQYKDVHAYFYITESGRRYLRLRAKMEDTELNAAN